MEVEITQTPPEAVTTDLRKIGKLSGLEEGPWKKLCDYLIVFRSGNENIAILIELKKTLNDDNKGQQQLRRSLPLLKYLHSICCIEFNATGSETLTVRYFLIGKKYSQRFDKQPVKPGLKIDKENYKNIEVYTFVGDRISFDKLIC